jgi:basic membrane protein A
MKKIIGLIFALIVVLTIGLTVFSACKPEETYEIALVTDVGNIDDKSFNEGAWNGVKQFAEENNLSYAYFRPAEDSTEARVETIGTAVDKGAKIVVCPGYLFEEAIYIVQDRYPNVCFLLLDGEPHDAAFTDFKTATNVHCILYKEEQAGFLAGYAAVKEGFTKLGFLGGIALPSVVRYGYGFIQGAEAAAVDEGLADGSVQINYWYSGDFKATDEVKTKMAAWYSAGTEVIFACGGPVYLSAVAAANEAQGKKVIGVDVDQAAESELIITSAMKELTLSVKEALTSFYQTNHAWDTNRGGKTLTLGANENGVGLPTKASSWRFTTFTVEQYTELFNAIKDGALTISDNTTVVPQTTKVVADFQNQA